MPASSISVPFFPASASSRNQSPETYSQEYGGFIHFPFYFYFIFLFILDPFFFFKLSFEFEGELFFNKYLEVFLP